MGCDCVIHVIKEGLSEEEKLANSQVVSTGAEDKFEAVGFSSCSACGVILWLLGVRRPGLEAGAGGWGWKRCHRYWDEAGLGSQGQHSRDPERSWLCTRAQS